MKALNFVVFEVCRVMISKRFGVLRVGCFFGPLQRARVGRALEPPWFMCIARLLDLGCDFGGFLVCSLLFDCLALQCAAYCFDLFGSPVCVRARAAVYALVLLCSCLNLSVRLSTVAWLVCLVMVTLFVRY
jgi:hypothetical protein